MFLPFPPKSISIDVTKKCNLSCAFCYLTGLKAKKISFYKGGDFLPLDLFEKLISQVSHDQGVRINFTGGEPFLHPQIFEMISYAWKKKCSPFILTNGVLLDEILLSKMFSGFYNAPHSLLFSIDGLKSVNDELRGTGTYDKIIEVIKEIQKRKIILGFNHPQIIVNTVINKLNIPDLSEMVLEFENLGIGQINFFYVEWSNKEIIDAAKAEFSERLNWQNDKSRIIEGVEHNLGNLNPPELESLFNGLERIKKIKSYSSIKIKFSPDFPIENKEEIRQWFQVNKNKIKGCRSVFSSIRIDTDGSVCPVCSFIYYPFGNLKSQSLKEILENEKAVSFFSEIKERGYFIACQKCMRRDA